MRKTDVDDLRAIVRDGRPRPVLLLGAGASATSGVPLVWQLVDLIGRYAYCRRYGRDMDDPTLMRSDWYPWVSAHDWFDPTLELQELYARHIKELLEPRERRRQFLQQHVLVSPDKASIGYRSLASLVGKRRIHSILTPNFETLIYDSCRRDPSATLIIQIQSPAQAGLISTDPPGVCQVIHVHGVVEHYADLNLTEEVAQLDPTYAGRIVPLVADHPVIVIGYRGAELSVYRDLLLAAAASGPVALPHGIYWCSRSRDGDLHPHVLELAEKCGGNFALVEIEAFDELMLELDADLTRVPSSRPAERLPFDARSADASAPFDDDLVLRVLDATALSRLALPLPHTVAPGQAARERLRLMNLLATTDHGEKLTNAGRLLFATNAPVTATIHSFGVVRSISGNAFQLYEQLTDLITEANEPYRVKGPESFDVRPYPPLAIKELLVNALAHRDYETELPIEVAIDEQRLRVGNPGGLLEPDDIDDLGERAVRHYRNPSLAESLYATGLMDKYGSGLVDVSRWAREGGAVATFDVGDQNARFEAVLTSRADSRPGESPVVPDGSYEVFYVNALPVSVPDEIWIGSTPARRPRDVFDAHPGEPVPRFALDGRNLYTFSHLADDANPLLSHVEAPERHLVSDVSSTTDGQAHLLELLNRIFDRHMQADGTEVHHRKGRLWFHINDDGSDREVEYRARMRVATRTVARRKAADSRRPYYEHQAMAWSFEYIQGEWLLTVDPTWVFTTDGRGKLETRRRTTQLSTRKMGNERNQSVLNHIFFWAWAICRDADLAVLGDDSDGVCIARTPLRRDAVGLLPSQGSGVDDEPDPDDLEHLDGEADDDLDEDEFNDFGEGEDS